MIRQDTYTLSQITHQPLQRTYQNLPNNDYRKFPATKKYLRKQLHNYYQQALQDIGYTQRIEYQEERPKRKRNRKRTITWFNPPFSKNIKTDIARRFLKMLDKHFPKKSKLHKIFNRSIVKVSYSNMPNVERIIKNHNRLTNEKDV